MELEEIISILQDSFKNEDIKSVVLDEYWYNLNSSRGIHSTGFCFSASEVIYRLTGGSSVWTVCRISDPKDWKNGTHYYLKHKITNEILDITSSQYTERGIEIPYHLGKGTGLRFVSKKAQLLAQLSGLELN